MWSSIAQAAFALKERVGANGGAVEEDEIFIRSDFAETFGDGLGGVGGRGENFEHAKPAGGGIDPDAVGESTAGVDGDAKRLGRAGHARSDKSTICRI